MIATPPSPQLTMEKTKTLFDPPTKTEEKSATLIFYKNGLPYDEIKLSKDITTLGSGAQNDITITDTFVSDTHCKIEKRGPLFFLIDRESKNGTYLNAILIKETSLQDKNTISIGKSLIEFSADKKEEKQKTRFQNMLSHSALMQNIFSTIEKVSRVQETVIIYGETGTGKEMIARAVHALSHRKHCPFIVVNCGAIPRELIESELFGHEKGAFTGAIRKRIGSFEAAQGGTLFLDEIGELPIDLQPKLLRAIENREVKPVGSNHAKKINVRIVAATHQNLSQKIKEGSFRSDLFYRLHLVPIELPALRNRKEDIPLLIHHFSGGIKTTAKALKIFIQYDWPGNVRELKNVIERIRVFIEQPIITEKDVQNILNIKPKPFLQTLHHMERGLLREFLDRNAWNKSQTARALSIPKSTLMDKIKRFDLKPGA